MKPGRSALPLPRYVLRKPLRGGAHGYFFNVPVWARKAGCPVKNEALGTDYEAAVQRAETVLLKAFDSWRAGGTSDAPPEQPGRSSTLDWLFADYKSDCRYTKLDPAIKRNHEVGFRMVGDHIMQDGRRLGAMRLASITTSVVDKLYEKLL